MARLIEITEQEAMLATVIKTVRGALKSKTIWGNTIGIPTILLALKSLGVATGNPLVVTGAYIGANILLRVLTRIPLVEK